MPTPLGLSLGPDSRKVLVVNTASLMESRITMLLGMFVRDFGDTKSWAEVLD